MAARPLSARRLRRLLAVAFFAVLGLVVLAGCTPYQTEGWMRLHNDRTGHGVTPAGWRADLQAKAQKWANHLAQAGVPFGHSRLTDDITGCWRVLGENIAQNYSIAGAEQAFMNSPGHRANILNPNFGLFAVGVARTRDGRVYVVQEFAQPC